MRYPLSVFILLSWILGLLLPASVVQGQCPVSSFPYTESFESATAPNFPCGWQVGNNNNDSEEWIVFNGPDAYGAGSQYAAISFNSNLAMDDWLFTPQLQLQNNTTYELQFYYKGKQASQYDESIEVFLGTAQNASNMTTSLFNDSSVDNSTYQLVTEQFTTPPSSGPFHIGFYGYSPPNQYVLQVDNIQIDELSQTCPKPINLTSSNFTSSSAEIKWSANANNTFEVEYGPSGFTQGSGTTISGVNDTSVTLTGLSADNTYDTYVRQQCSQDTSNFSGPETFVLNDSCIYAIPAACNTTINGTTNGASIEHITGATCGNSINTQGVWYTFTGNGNMISATTCSQLTTFDTKISVFKGSCGNLVCVAENDDIGQQCPFGNNYSQVNWSSNVGTKYYILVHGYNGQTGNFLLTVNSQILADAGIDDTTCIGDTTTLTATGGTQYNWSNGDTTQSINVAPSTTTDYTVTVSTPNGCSDSDTVRVVATDSTDGGTVSTENGQDTVNVCIDNSPSIVQFDSSTNATPGASYSYIITNASHDTLLGTPSSDQADFNPSGIGECHVWGVSHVGGLNPR